MWSRVWNQGRERHHVLISPYIETVSGKSFHFLEPSDDEIDITDIAYALSNMCRYTGHSKRFYSVAEHSIYVAQLLPPELRLAGLLHDASEAYLGDVSSPLKQLLPEYKEIEKTVEAAIARRFELLYPHDPLIKQMDLQQLCTEAHHLLPSGGKDWEVCNGYMPEDGVHPRGVPPALAYQAFMTVYERLTGKTTVGVPESRIILA